MPSQTHKINAAISYFFLGPLFLLAKKNTPFAEKFVHDHAKKSSLILFVGIIFMVILSQLKGFLLLGIAGFSLYGIIFWLFLLIFFTTIIYHAYGAYQWIAANELLNVRKNIAQFSLEKKSYSETEKARIILSFFPFLGIIIAEKTPLPEIITGRKVAHFFIFFLILSSSLQGFVSFFTIALLIAYIATIVSVTVFLFLEEKFLSFEWYRFIPQYHHIESSIVAGIIIIKHYISVAFWNEKTKNFSEIRENIIADIQKPRPISTKFWTHPVLISLPFVNTIFLPTLFHQKYHEYHSSIIEGLSITLGLGIFLWKIPDIAPLIWLFPIVTLGVYVSKNIRVHAPISGFSLYVFALFLRWKEKIIHLKNESKQNSVTFSTQNRVSDILSKEKNPKNINEKISHR